MQAYRYKNACPATLSWRTRVAILMSGLILVLGGSPAVSSAEGSCASGLYAVGSQCLRDPCEAGGTCYYVDARDGRDSNSGTSAAPWQTIDRVNNATSGLNPGDYVLFHRDRDWGGTHVLRANNISGSENEPITFGAYGEGARPRVQGIRIKNSSHITIRDFEQPGSQGGPCTSVRDSGYIILQDLHVHDCANNGLSFGSGTHHGVMIDNRVWDIPANDALSIHDSSTGTVGDHHWIVDNVVTGRIAEQPIDIATGNDNVRGARDHKVVGNRVRGGGNGCIVLGHGTSMGWLVGNFAGECTRSETAFATAVSGKHGARSGSHFYNVGNVTFSNLMSSLQTAGEDPSVPLVYSHHNTYVHSGKGRRPVVRGNSRIDFTMHHNILWPTGSLPHVQLRSADDVTAMNDNWYVEEDNAGCSILGRTLNEWQASSSHDSRSSCGSIPGMSNPSAADIANVDVWNTAGFQAHFIPDPSWAGCAAGIGAFDCSGKQRIEFEPFTDFASDNGGYGWAGPAIVRERYPLGGSQPPPTARCDVTYSLPDNQWRQISLPCNAGANSSVAAVFGDDISGAYADDWALFNYDGNGFVQLDESSDSLDQGVGYWIIQTSGSAVTLDMPANSTETPVIQSAACIAASDGCFDMPLSTSGGIDQWNMIGYPFDSAASLGNVRIMTNAGSCATGCDLDTALSQNLVHNQLWTYDGSAYSTLSTGNNLNPWTGYWVNTMSQAAGSDPRFLTPKP